MSSAIAGRQVVHATASFPRSERVVTLSMVERLKDDVRQGILVDAAQAQLNQASDAVQDLSENIEAFEATLTPHEEVQVVIVGGPAGSTLFLSAVTPLGADRIRFDGVTQEGRRATIIQHVSQMNVMLQSADVGELMGRRGTFSIVTTDRKDAS